MLIRRIEVKNFRKLIGPVVIDGLKEGINVISGDNEEGKSTLLQALKAAFFQRHNATGQQVREFLPYNCEVRPEVLCDFEVTGKKFRVQKGFCTKPYFAEFHSPTAKFQGAEAEEQIRELFNMSGAEKGKKGSDLDHGIWGLLWLEQGSATEGLRTSDGGRETLMKVLESDLHMVLGGESGRVLSKQISALYAKYFTNATGKERGEYKDARENQTNASQRYRECYQKYEQYKKKLADLAAKQDALAAHQREKSLDKAKADIEQSVKDLQMVERLRLEEQGAKQGELAANLEYVGKKEKLDSRRDLAIRRASLEKQLVENESAIDVALQSVNECKTESETLLSKHQTTESVLQRAEKDCQDAEKRDELVRLLRAKADLESRINAVEVLQLESKTQSAEIDKISIEQSVLEVLRNLESQKIEAEIRADTAATKLIVRPLSSKQASIGKDQISSGEEVLVTKKTTITLKDWGEIDVAPGGEDTGDREAARKTKNDEFLSALAKAGVATLQEAQDLLDKRKQCVSNVEQTKKQIATICGAGGLESIQIDLQKIVDEIKKQAVSDSQPIIEQRELAELRKEREAARELEKNAKDLYEKSKEGLVKATAEHAQIMSAKSTLSVSLSDLEKQLKALSLEDIAAQEAAVKDAEEKYLNAQNAAKLKSLELNKLNPEEIKKKHQEFTVAANKLEAEIMNLKTDVSGLTASIEAHGQAGLGEELERLEGENELAVSQFKRTERKALALKLLYETLTESEQQAKEQFLEPVIEKLNPHLQTLFPGANILLNEQSVEISHLQRNGVNEGYEKLSVGTREQLSVLTRLSIASLLKAKGQPTVVVLDDALVYSDDGRIAKMKEILNEVSGEFQVIILTCRLRDYENMQNAHFVELQTSLITA
ncbi:AAA family ATPase [soil metagenome]